MGSVPQRDPKKDAATSEALSHITSSCDINVQFSTATQQLLDLLLMVLQVLQESFDPIIDKATKENLLLLMTKAEVKGEYDYRGMYTALLTHQGRAVCAAVFRAFGAQLAEVPLVATKADARRQGHCRVLMNAFEVLLKEVKHIVGNTPRHTVLPACPAVK